MTTKAQKHKDINNLPQPLTFVQMMDPYGSGSDDTWVAYYGDRLIMTGPDFALFDDDIGHANFVTLEWCLDNAVAWVDHYDIENDSDDPGDVSTETAPNGSGQTYGEKIDALVQKYCNLYDIISGDSRSPLYDDPRGMTLVDLKMGIFVYEQAINKVTEYIDSKERGA